MQPVFTPYNTCSDTMLHFGAMTLSSSFIQCMKQQWILPSKNCSPIDLNLLQIHFETVYGTCKIYSVNKIRKLFDFAISLKANSNRIYIPTYVSHATCQPKYKKKENNFQCQTEWISVPNIFTQILREAQAPNSETEKLLFFLVHNTHIPPQSKYSCSRTFKRYDEPIYYVQRLHFSQRFSISTIWYSEWFGS